MASAPGKIILFGEHAVVYGVPSIAVPLSDLRVKVNWAITKSGNLNIIAEDLENKEISLKPNMSDINNPFARIVQQILDYYDATIPSGYIKITSDIPIASGLGSGAAVSTAIGRAIAQMLGYNISNDDLNSFVFEVEKIHHGTPSGIDNTVIVYEKAIKFKKNHPIEPLSISKPFNILIADTGIPAPTHEAVGDVKDLYENNTDNIQNIFDDIESIVNSATEAIKIGNLVKVGKLMIQSHKLLQALTVSSRELDILVETAIQSGALGAKLSGGGRGGNMIALVPQTKIEAVKHQLLSAGAKRVLLTTVK